MTKIELLPTSEISIACASEKSVRHGHISTLQFWWARRPLAVCRSAIFLALCPEAELIASNPILISRLRMVVGNEESVETLLKKFSGILSLWKSAESIAILDLARDIIKLRYPDGPVVIDPFAGGGSIPLEALRLGAHVFCGDLNPVAFCSLELAVKYAPTYGQDLLLAYTNIAFNIHKRIRSEFKDVYDDLDGQPLAYLWARTYKCPTCAKIAPLVRSKILAKGTRNVAYKFIYNDSDTPAIEILSTPSLSEMRIAGNPTVDVTGAKCENCGARVPTSYLQKEGVMKRLGEMPIASYRLTGAAKSYCSPEPNSISKSQIIFGGFDFTAFEDIEFDKNAVRHIWAMQYGINTVKDIFNPRQFGSLCLLQQIIREELDNYEHPDKQFCAALSILFAQTLNRLVMYSNRHSWWQASGEFPANIFVRQAISMVWDYVEIPPNSDNAGGWKSACSWISKVLEHLIALPAPATVYCGDAAHLQIADKSVDLVFTDPPYFDSITYAYLSDLFFAWMRPILIKYYPMQFLSNSTPKKQEAIVDRKHKSAPSPKNSKHFQTKMFEFFTEAGRVLKDDGNLMIMYGHKKPAAWSAFFDPMAKAGFLPFSSIAIHTERKVKFKHSKIDALATSCLISCKFGNETSGVLKTVEWTDFVQTLNHTFQTRKDKCADMSISGGDMLGSFISDAVTLFYSRQVIDGQGKRVSTEMLFAELQEIGGV